MVLKQNLIENLVSAAKCYKGEMQGVPGDYRVRGSICAQIVLKVAASPFLLPLHPPPHQMV